jgi:alpha-beta hydrolase superfamily lysophospholipase
MSESDNRHTPKPLVERREFLGGAATLAGASLIGRANGSSLLGLSTVAASATALPEPPPEPAPVMSADVEHRTKRWQEQRWLLDAVIQVIGPEWDEGRLNGQVVDLCGPDVISDVNGIRGRVRKFNDLTREFARAAVRREKMARQSEERGNTIAAREDYFMAAILYMYAQWPIFEKTRELLALNERKNNCYAKYIQFAEHEIQRVEIPLGSTGKSMPGYLHLPPNRSGRVPCVWDIIGVGGTRERSSALYGDKLRERGIATLGLDGPGHGESIIREIYVTPSIWMDAGRSVLSWLRSQKEIDPDRIALSGTSMGTCFATQIASIDDRLKGVATRAMTHEPGLHSLFEMDSPSWKLRFMYMAGLQTEEQMDKTWQPFSVLNLGDKIKCPYLTVAGEDDQLSRIEYTYQMLDAISAPKQMLLYEGANHGVAGSAATTNGPNPRTFIADWLKDRLDGKPMETKHMKVDAAGTVHESTFEEARKSLSLLFLT